MAVRECTVGRHVQGVVSKSEQPKKPTNRSGDSAVYAEAYCSSCGHGGGNSWGIVQQYLGFLADQAGKP